MNDTKRHPKTITLAELRAHMAWTAALPDDTPVFSGAAT